MQQLCICRKVAIPLPDGMTWDAFLQQARHTWLCKAVLDTAASSAQLNTLFSTDCRAYVPLSANSTLQYCLRWVLPRAPASADPDGVHARRFRRSCG